MVKFFVVKKGGSIVDPSLMIILQGCQRYKGKEKGDAGWVFFLFFFLVLIVGPSL